ncbi:Hypothetical predicted protein [Olea europaea subsp. europaea]|uniref:Uncharacterized protein n=1 Tax=Olea europaea subsp. europaea TaxID=158383 RepID=A0A8S0UKQ6_OLEEU|nr:Hypothetical predicted protein [Olea europaea subsp. europaea]
MAMHRCKSHRCRCAHQSCAINPDNWMLHNPMHIDRYCNHSQQSMGVQIPVHIDRDCSHSGRVKVIARCSCSLAVGMASVKLPSVEREREVKWGMRDKVRKYEGD